MDRTERLLNLVTFFLDARGAVTLEDVRDAFPDEYSGSPDASQRKFERDKAELYELGVPLRFEPQNDDSPGGYVLDRKAYYLPDPGFSSAELAVLYAAGSAALASGAFPGRQELGHALRKIGFFSDEPLPTAQVRLELGDSRELPARLETIWSAIGARKSLDLDYWSPRSKQTTTRKVDPWGLALRHGVWNLVGWCHLRKALRTFHVHRVRRVDMNAQKPKQADFEVPADFKVDDHVANFPWEHRIHEPTKLTVRLGEGFAPLAPQLFGVEAKEGKLELEVTFVDPLLNQLLALGQGTRIEAPAHLQAELVARAQKVLSLHGGTP
ncbi:MAG: WYL domain-containing protein [Myxococcaceae bacterium]